MRRLQHQFRPFRNLLALIVLLLLVPVNIVKAQPSQPKADFEREVSGGESLWTISCSYAIELMKHYNQEQKRDLKPGESNELLDLCLKDMRGKPKTQADSLARCMLHSKDVLGVLQCGESRKARRPSIYEQACEHMLGLALAHMGDDGELGKAEWGRLHRECILDYHRKPEGVAQRMAECVLDSKRLDEATQCERLFPIKLTAGEIPLTEKHGALLWEEACEHTIKRIIAEGGPEASIVDKVQQIEMSEDCNQHFQELEKDEADKLARCVLAAPTLSAMEKCPERIEQGLLDSELNAKIPEPKELQVMPIRELVRTACVHVTKVMAQELKPGQVINPKDQGEMVDSCVISSLTTKERDARKRAICLLKAEKPAELTRCAEMIDNPWEQKKNPPDTEIPKKETTP